VTTDTTLKSLLTEKRYDLIEGLWKEALADPIGRADFLLQASLGLARAGQKSRLQTLATAADAALRAHDDPEAARLRWSLLKEAVKAGATPSTNDGFHKLFEEVLSGAYPGSPSLTGLLGKFKFREAKEPADGLARAEKVEKWLPFEVGRCFMMAGRGAGKVVETNHALDAVRVDFEKAKGISVPIGVAARSLVPLPEGHFLLEKLTDFDSLAAKTMADPPGTLKRLLDSFGGKALTLAGVKEAVSGLVPESAWTSWWTSAKKHPQVVVHGSGKSATIEWSSSAASADVTLFTKFEKASLKEKMELFRKNAKRSPELGQKMAADLGAEAHQLKDTDPSRAFEVGILVEKSGVASLPFGVEELVPDDPMKLLSQLSDRQAREGLLEIFQKKRPEAAAKVFADWFLKEDDARTLDWIDRRLATLDPEGRERLLEKLLKSPRSGAKAFFWCVQQAQTDDGFRARLNANVLARLLDALSWEELGAARTKVREMFDRTGLAASWIMKQATVEDMKTFLEALERHNDLEAHRRKSLVAAAEMRFPELRKEGDEVVFVTPEALEAKRHELDQIIKVDIPENTKGIAIAAAEGDLSENFEYKARRDKQQLLSARAGKLQEELAKARALDPATIDATEVRPGTKVTVVGPGGTRSVTLLGPWDSRPEDFIYSYLSDLGRLLLGKRPGDAVEVLGEPGVIEKVEPWR